MSDQQEPAGAEPAAEKVVDFVPNPAHDLHLAVDEATGEEPPRSWLPVRVLEWVGGVLSLLLAVGITVAVLLRVLGIATTGVVELGALSMLFLVLLGAPALASRDEHVRLELMDFVLGARGLRWLDHFGTLVQLAVVVMLVIATWNVTQVDLVRGTTAAGDLRIPRWIVSGAALVGFVAVGAGVVHRWLGMVRTPRKES